MLPDQLSTLSTFSTRRLAVLIGLAVLALTTLRPAQAAEGDPPAIPPAVSATPPAGTPLPATAPLAGASQAAPLTGASQAAPDYRLTAGDLVRFEVFNQADLTVTTRIPESGGFAFPLIGEVTEVVGRPVAAVVAEIKGRLEKDFLRQAQVTATIVEMLPRKIYILGSVAQQNAIVLPPYSRTTAMQAIGQAGGFLPDADRAKVVVIRDDPARPGVKVSLPVEAALHPDQLTQDIVLQPGDMLSVPGLGVQRVYVTGKVKSSGAYALPPNEKLTVSKVITLAGGFEQFARRDQVQLIRVGERTQVINVQGILNGEVHLPEPVLTGGDTINIPDSRF